jgi:Outer membrane protein Omp28/Secretion system C-terminal sorting domain/Cleaved Adhesin Domain
MKKSLLFLALMSASYVTSNAQTVFSENFDAVPLTPASGTGTGSIPAGWVQYNVDAKTPVTSRNFMGTNAWVVRSTSAAPTNKWATSCSWYTPAGIANDWMVTPSIAIPATGTVVLQFDVKANDPTYPDGYKIYVSTTGNTVADFPVTPIFSEAAAPSAAFTNRTVNLSSFAGQNVYIAIRNNSNDMDLLFVDNIVVKTLLANDANLAEIVLDRYVPLNSNSPLTMNIENRGANPITSLTIDWNDGTSHSQTITGLNIAVGATDPVVHPTNISYATAVEKNIAVSISQVNGATDPDVSNNNKNTALNSISSIETKYVLMEEGTGTWCGWCPRGTVAMGQFTNGTYPQFIGIAVHNGDPMTVAAYDAGNALSGYPGCNVDRKLRNQSVSTAAWTNFYNARKTLSVPASVSVSNTYDPITRQLSASATAHFVTPFANANYRLAIVVVENNVTGTTANYGQVNYYAGGANGVMGGYELLPATVPAAQMVYDEVGRALLGGYNGEAGSVPTTIIDGQNATYTFNYTLPQILKPADIKLVALLIDQSTGEVINAKEEQMSLVSGLANVANVNANVVSIYPNPSNNSADIFIANAKKEVSVKIYNTIGQIVWASNTAAVNGIVKVNTANFETGNYFVEVINAGQKTNSKLVVVH